MAWLALVPAAYGIAKDALSSDGEEAHEDQGPGLLGTGTYKPRVKQVGVAGFQNVDSGYGKSMTDHYLAETNRRAPPKTQAATAADQSLGQGYQAQLMGQLSQQAQGKGPSLASMQMQQGVEASLRAQQAAAASQKGQVNSALLMRGLQSNAAAQQQTAAAQSAQMKMQEQLSAQQQLAGVSAADRSASAQYALANAGFQQQAALANQQAILQNRQLTDAQRRAMLGLRTQISEADRQAMMEREKLNAQMMLEEEKMRAQAFQAAGQARQGMIAGLGSAAAGVFSASDEKGKKQSNDGAKAVQKSMSNWAHSMPNNPWANFGDSVSAAAAAESENENKIKARNELARRDAQKQFADVAQWGKDYQAKHPDVYGPQPGAAPTQANLEAAIVSGKGFENIDTSKFDPSWREAMKQTDDPWKDSSPSKNEMLGILGFKPESAPSPKYEPAAVKDVDMPWAKTPTTPSTSDEVQFQAPKADMTLESTGPLPVEESPYKKTADDNQAKGQMWGAISAMGANSSDERAKNARSGEEAIERFMATIKPHVYEYKDPNAPGAAPGKHLSPMAQEFEKSDLGEEAVFVGPDGKKMVNYGRIAGVQAAALGNLHERLSKLEKRK